MADLTDNERLCEFDGCSKHHYSKGLCKSHRQQQRRGGPLRELRPQRSAAELDAEFAAGLRTCCTCKLQLPLSKFYAGGGRNGLHNRCKMCAVDKFRQQKYGLTSAAWEEAFEAQGGVCGICGTGKPGGNGWQTDHDHDCCPGEWTCGRCVRGILCVSCNQRLGWYEANRDAADRYLAAPPLAN